MKNAVKMSLNYAAFAQSLCAASSCPESGVIARMIWTAKALLGSMILLPAAAGARMTVHPSPLCPVR